MSNADAPTQGPRYPKELRVLKLCPGCNLHYHPKELTELAPRLQALSEKKGGLCVECVRRLR